MFDIYVERFMYFLWIYIPFEAIPLEIAMGVVLAAVSVAAYVAFVSAFTLWDKAQELLDV